MKSILLFLFCSTAVITVKAQTYNYHPFPDSNIIWQGYYSCGVHNTGWTENWSYGMNGDTTMNGRIYHKISGFGWEREDSNNRVYFINLYDTTGQELIMYDFSLSVDDTIAVWGYTLRVTNVDTPSYFGIPRRTLHLQSTYDFDEWIDGIGSYWGPMGTSDLFVFLPCHFSVLCRASQDSVILFQRSPDVFSNGCSYLNSITDENFNNTITISPNPAATQLNINTSGAQVEDILLYNITGLLIQRIKQPLNSPIDISSFSSGIYIAQIKMRQNTVIRKWVKM